MYERESKRTGEDWKNIGRKNELEIEVVGKIRNFIDDPRLKFHFSTINRMGSILDRGVLSYEFAKRATIEIRENMSVRGGGVATEDRSVSIVDREKNASNEESDDWWIRQFSRGDTNVGFLLPDDIKLRDTTPQTNESLVPIRIRRERFEGIFVTERKELYETLESRRNRSKEKYPDALAQGHNYGVILLSQFFDYTAERLKSLDGVIAELDRKISDAYSKNNLWLKDRKTWPTEILDEVTMLEREEADRMEVIARTELEKIVGKPAGEITEKDLFVYFAQKNKLPLYFVSKDFKSQRVIWPEV